MSALPSADAVLLVSDAAQEYTGPELEFLGAAMKLCPNVGCVLTKTDLYPHWRRIDELDRGHLRDAGIRAEIFPVSSTLRLLAAKNQDTAMLDESGFRELVELPAAPGGGPGRRAGPPLHQPGRAGRGRAARRRA